MSMRVDFIINRILFGFRLLQFFLNILKKMTHCDRITTLGFQKVVKDWQTNKFLSLARSRHIA